MSERRGTSQSTARWPAHRAHAEPTALVIFGASGDLTRRKLLPAVYQLSRGQRLPARFDVLGVARSPMTDDAVPHSSSTTASRNSPAWQSPTTVSSALDRTTRWIRPGRDGRPRALQADRRGLARSTGRTACSSTWRSRRSVYATIVEQLSAAGLTKPPTPDGWRRIIVEKPFGDRSRQRARAEPGPAHRTSTSRRSSASITISARRPSRTCWCSASPTACSSRCGTAATSITCRSPPPRPSASSGAPTTTKGPARCATWCRTT